MGVYSYCVSSTASIVAENFKPALAALKQGISEHSFLDDLNIPLCTTLPEAMTQLSFEYELDNGDLTKIQFSGGKNDQSIFVFPLLAPFIEEGGRIVMDVEDQREITTFEDGCMYCDVVDDYDDDEDEDELSDLADEFMEKVQELKFNEKDVAAVVKAEGHLNFQDYEQNTPLLLLLQAAVDELDLDVIKKRKVPSGLRRLIDLLLAQSPNLNTVNEDHETALLLALAAGWYDLAQQFIDAGAELFIEGAENPFTFASRSQNRDLFDFVVANGGQFEEHVADTFVMACEGTTGRAGAFEFAQFLHTEFNCDLNLTTSRRFHSRFGEVQKGATALMVAAFTDNLPLVKYLLEHGANPIAVDALGNTALHYCAGQNWTDTDGALWFKRDGNHEVVNALSTHVELVALKNVAGLSAYALARRDNPEALVIMRDALAKRDIELPVEIDENLNGEVVFSGHDKLGYRLNFVNGKLSGKQEFIHKSGTLFVEIEYQDGQAHGDYTAYWDNGEPMFQAHCMNGKWHGNIRLMDEKGNIGQELNYVEGRRHGEQMLRDGSGEPVLTAHYQNGKKHGRFFFRKSSGEVVIDEEYVDGVPAAVAEKENENENEKEKPKGLAGLFGALLGGLTKGSIAAEFAEDKLKPTEKLFFHQPKKVIALVEKTELRRLG